MKVGYLITGRLKSTRLPKKLLLEINGKPIISHMIDRLKLANKINEIIICSSTNEQDMPLADIASKNGIKCYFGDPDDVLARLLEAADKFNLDYILNITADCPFVDPYYADKIVDKYIETNADLIRQFDLPHGVFSYGIKVEALRKVVKIKDSTEYEKILFSSQCSPFWTRVMGHLSTNLPKNSKECEKFVNPVLNYYKIGKIFIGHSPTLIQNLGINSTCDESVYRVDTGFAQTFDKYRKTPYILQVLEILNDNEINIIV